VRKSEAPCKGHFSFEWMTDKRDRNKNTFFGHRPRDEGSGSLVE
jgi:hypothetical protein